MAAAAFCLRALSLCEDMFWTGIGAAQGPFSIGAAVSVSGCVCAGTMRQVRLCRGQVHFHRAESCWG